jgi:acetylornithine aminotransferase
MDHPHLLRCIPPTGVAFVRGANCRLWDDRGDPWLDLESGSWAALLGHGHPRINRALKDQIDRIMHLNVRHPGPLAEGAAGRLLDTLALPGGKAVFLSSGSEAVEFGVQALRRITGRPLLLTLERSYLAAFGSAGSQEPDGWRRVDPEAPGDLDALPYDRIAGLVLEPGGGSPAFGRFPPAPLVTALAQRVRAAGGLVLANEITTGMGRTGTWLGSDPYRLGPELVALGKGLGNGYPVSAVAMAAGPARALEATGLHYAQSHQNNPLGCAVALEVLEELAEGGWIERGRQLGAELLERIRALPDPHGRVRAVRGRGMLIVLEFQPGCGLDGEAGFRFLFDRRILCTYLPAGHPSGTGLRFDPALTVETADLDVLVEALGDLLALPDCSPQ